MMLGNIEPNSPTKAFYMAAIHGNIEVVRDWLKNSAVKEDVKVLNKAFQAAAKCGHLEVVRELLTFPTVDLTANNYKAFHKAARNGHLAVVRELLTIAEMQTYLGITDNAGIKNRFVAFVRQLLDDTPRMRQKIAKTLQIATIRGDLEVVRELLAFSEVKALVTAENNAAFRVAVEKGHLEVVRELLTIPEVKALASADNNAALRIAVERGHLELVRELLAIPEVKALASADNNAALRMAVNQGQVEMAHELLAIPEVKALVLAAFRMAVEKGHLEVVRELLAIPEVKALASADNNAALRMAINNGQVEIVRELLAIPEVKAQALNEDFKVTIIEILRTYLSRFPVNIFLEILLELLRIPGVKERIIIDDSQAKGYIKCLALAASINQLELVRELLAIPEIKNQPADYYVICSIALKTAVKKGYVEIVSELLSITAVKSNVAGNDNLLLRTAALNHDLEMVRELLTIPEVRQGAAAKNNEALRYAITSINISMMRELLQCHAVLDTIDDMIIGLVAMHSSRLDSDFINFFFNTKAVTEKLSLKLLLHISYILNYHPQLNTVFESTIRKQCLSQQTLLKLANQLHPEYSGAEKQDVLLQYLHYYGYPPISAELTGKERLNAIKQCIEHSFIDYFDTPQSHAGKILQAIANVNDIKKEHYRNQMTNIEGNDESAMEESLINEAIKRFKMKIEPLFGKRFIEMGGIEGIEPQIISLILERKIAQLKQHPAGNSQEMIDFIEKNKVALMQREEAALAESRKYFTSHTDTFDIAFRAFDADAASHGWEKLFVAPKKGKENNAVFSTSAASNSPLTLQQTTDITRKVLCYAYVVAQDESLTPEGKSCISDALIHYLAEISRAHNDTHHGSDNPSCYPGTITRLDLIFQKHPKFTVDKDLFKTTADIASHLVVKAFSTELSLCENYAAKLELFEALTLFSQENAREILHQPKLVSTTEGLEAPLADLLLVRKAFFEKYFGQQGNDGIEKINAILLENQLFVDAEMAEVALLPLLNMSRATPSTTFSLTEAFQRATPADKAVPMDIVTNPYKPDYQQILTLLPLPPGRKEQMAKARYTENKIKAALFEYFSQNTTGNSDTLAELTENTYQDAKEAIFVRNDDVKIHEWSFYEQIINTFMNTVGIPRDKFPTENSINNDIAHSTIIKQGKKHLRDSNDDSDETQENATQKPALLLSKPKGAKIRRVIKENVNRPANDIYLTGKSMR